MRIIRKNRLSFRQLLEICRIDEKAWDFGQDIQIWIYWASILAGAGSPNVRKYNSVYLAKNDDGKCIGYLMAYVSNKPKIWHPVLTLIYFLCYFVFLFFKDGRLILAWRRLYYYQWITLVNIGKQYLAGKDYNKISEGCCVAIYPEYRKQGIYREMTKMLMDDVNGYFLFQTTTESDYQAHEAMGYKKIFEAPFFWPEKETTFIMYGEKKMLKL